MTGAVIAAGRARTPPKGTKERREQNARLEWLFGEAELAGALRDVAEGGAEPGAKRRTVMLTTSCARRSGWRAARFVGRSTYRRIPQAHPSRSRRR